MIIRTVGDLRRLIVDLPDETKIEAKSQTLIDVDEVEIYRDWPRHDVLMIDRRRARRLGHPELRRP